MKRKLAREKLVAIGKRAVPALIETLTDERDAVRWEAAKALTELHDRRAAPALVAALGDSNGDVRWLAAEALIGLGPAGLRPLLETLIDHANSLELREGAHHVLHNLRRGRWADVAAPVLRSLNGFEPELSVPVSAEAALQILKQQCG